MYIPIPLLILGAFLTLLGANGVWEHVQALRKKVEQYQAWLEADDGMALWEAVRRRQIALKPLYHGAEWEASSARSNLKQDVTRTTPYEAARAFELREQAFLEAGRLVQELESST